MEPTYNIISDTKVEITTVVPVTVIYDIAEFQPQMELLDKKIAELQAQKADLQAKIDSISAPLQAFKSQKANSVGIKS